MCNILEEVLDISVLFHHSNGLSFLLIQQSHKTEFLTKLTTHFDFCFQRANHKKMPTCQLGKNRIKFAETINYAAFPQLNSFRLDTQ